MLENILKYRSFKIISTLKTQSKRNVQAIEDAVSIKCDIFIQGLSVTDLNPYKWICNSTGHIVAQHWVVDTDVMSYRDGNHKEKDSTDLFGSQ